MQAAVVHDTKLLPLKVPELGTNVPKYALEFASPRRWDSAMAPMAVFSTLLQKGRSSISDALQVAVAEEAE